ncbi:MAG: T9SS type A sorting domain-containing protein [Cryomorphaceae bacterium]|nr:T9SS type A sorting domain-containing protein [Cryomorphaceae bacterium]
MKLINITVFLSILCSFAHAQFENGFIEVYPGFWANSVTELPDTSYVFDSNHNYFQENNGIRLYHINKNGNVIDSLSITRFNYPFMGRRGAMATLPDSTVVSFVRDDIFNAPDKAYLIRWQVFPQLDTLLIRQFYPDSGNTRWEGFSMSKIKTLEDGNILLSGYLYQPTPWTLQGYIAKITPNFDIIWEAVLEEPDNKARIINDIIPKADGTFFISGSARIRGVGNDKYEYVARIDSAGAIIWEHFFPTYIQKAPGDNYNIQGGQPYLALAQDSNVVVMYSRVLDCGPNGFWCTDQWWKGDYRFVKFDWDGNILIDKLIGSPDIEQAGPGSLEPVKSGGFVFSAAIFLPGYNTVVLRVSEQGDSLWWKEPYFEDGRRSGGDVVVAETVIPTIDNGFVGVGTATIPSFRNHPTDPHQFAYAFRLDSNGCFGPNHCHDSWLSVEELPALETGLSVYPNPAVNEVNVKLEKAAGNYEIILRDMQGREVRRSRMEETGVQERHVLLSIQGLPAGIYTIEVVGEKRYVVKVRVR